MTKIALACAVMLASLFTVSAQADAAGFNRYKPHGIHKHHVRKHKFHNTRKYTSHRAHKRLKAVRRFQKRHIFKRHRAHKPQFYVRRYR
jgi:hypothetical protein